MKLTFLGTRGNIETRNRLHRMHSSLMVAHYHKQVMLDCGEDWRGRLDELKPRAIAITHGHPDHAFGLKDGAPCPVYATADTWEVINGYPIEERHTLERVMHFGLEVIDSRHGTKSIPE